jgi:hypothetical protein
MEMLIEGVAHIPIDEAAAELKTTPVRILMLIRQGVMRGSQVDEEWFVEKKSMSCYRNYADEIQKPGGCKGSCSSGGCSMGD